MDVGGVAVATRPRRATLSLSRNRPASANPEPSAVPDGTPNVRNRDDTAPANPAPESRKPAVLVSVAGGGDTRIVELKGDLWRRVRNVADGNPALFVRKAVVSAVRARERQAKGQGWILTIPGAPASLGPRLAAAEAGGYGSVSDVAISILGAALADMGIPEPIPDGEPKAAGCDGEKPVLKTGFEPPSGGGGGA